MPTPEETKTPGIFEANEPGKYGYNTLDGKPRWTKDDKKEDKKEESTSSLNTSSSSLGSGANVEIKVNGGEEQKPGDAKAGSAGFTPGKAPTIDDPEKAKLIALKDRLSDINEVTDKVYEMMDKFGDPVMSPEELAVYASRPEMKEYAPQLYKIEKEKWDNKQAMMRTVAMSLIGGAFESLSGGAKGTVPSASAEAMATGALEIQTQILANEKLNQEIDKKNMEFVEKYNDNLKEYVNTYNKSLTGIEKLRNKLVIDVMNQKKEVWKDKLKTISDASKARNLIIQDYYKSEDRAAIELLKQTEANKRAEASGESRVEAANVSGRTRVSVANANNQTSANIANERNRYNMYSLAVKGIENKKRDMLSNPEFFSDAFALLDQIGGNSGMALGAMYGITKEDIQKHSVVSSRLADSYNDVVRGRVDAGDFDRPQVRSGILEKSYQDDAAALIDLSGSLLLTGNRMSPDLYRYLADSLSEEDIKKDLVSGFDQSGQPTVVIKGKLDQIYRDMLAGKELNIEGKKFNPQGHITKIETSEGRLTYLLFLNKMGKDIKNPSLVEQEKK
ncbi:MAG TPA: hypothetical protein PLZ43_07215 [bacterium]|nr:hypothetical protein [bacterium]